MITAKKDILAQLQKDILLLQGFKPPPAGHALDLGLGPMIKAFPNACFPVGAVHEFVSADPAHAAASSGFIAALLAGLMQGSRASVWISRSRTVFPPALKAFGIEPDRIIFIDLQQEKDCCWAMEEALKCGALAAVVGELQDISFTASRRLQLAVEKSRVTGFILRQRPQRMNTVAAVARWKINPLPSVLETGMPGVGFPRWYIELLKIRNGKPGAWELEWTGNAFRPVFRPTHFLAQEEKKKTG